MGFTPVPLQKLGFDKDGGAAGPVGPGVPVGGTTGQYLTKTSATDYDTDWTDTPLAGFTPTHVPFADGTGTLSESTNLTFDSTDVMLRTNVGAIGGTTASGIRVQETATPDSSGVNILAGHANNTIDATVTTSVIAGGGSATQPNRLLDTLGSQNTLMVIGGGYDNMIDAGFPSTIAGGAHHRINMTGAPLSPYPSTYYTYTASTLTNHCMIGGGSAHTIQDATYFTVGGGSGNGCASYFSSLTSNGATIGGGTYNFVSGGSSTLAGGSTCSIFGLQGSIAGGLSNQIYSNVGAIGGGSQNRIISGAASVIAGGITNQITTNTAQRDFLLSIGTGASAGTYTLSYNGYTTATIAYNANAAAITAALEALTSVGAGGVTVTATSVTNQYSIVFGSGVTAAWLYGNGALLVTGTFNIQPGQVWTVTLGSPSAGTFRLAYGRRASGAMFAVDATSDLAYNASAADVQTALEALNSLGAGNVAVSGSAGGPYTVTIKAAKSLFGMVGNGNGLTGGTFAVTAGSSQYSAILGGNTNLVHGQYTVIGGGRFNEVSADYSAVMGGLNSTIGNATNAFIGGGNTNLIGNTTASHYSTIAGGYINSINSQYGVIGGGSGNIIPPSAGYSVIAGGQTNSVSAANTTIGGGVTNTVTAQYGTVAGGINNDVSGLESTVGGGKNNDVSGADSVIAGGQNNIITTNNSNIGGGTANQVTGAGSSVIGGASNVSSGTNSVAGGSTCQATGNTAVAMGSACVAAGVASVALGASNTVGAGALGDYSAIVGGLSNAVTNRFCLVAGRLQTVSGENATAIGKETVVPNWGQFTQGAGKFAAVGDAQTSILLLRKQTTTATSTELVTNTAGIVVPTNDTTWKFRAEIVARNIDTDDESAGFTIEGVARRATTHASSTLIGGLSKTDWKDTGAAAWNATVDINTGTGRLRVMVTGEAAKNINWVCRLTLVEVTG